MLKNAQASIGVTPFLLKVHVPVLFTCIPNSKEWRDVIKTTLPLLKTLHFGTEPTRGAFCRGLPVVNLNYVLASLHRLYAPLKGKPNQNLESIVLTHVRGLDHEEEEELEEFLNFSKILFVNDIKIHFYLEGDDYDDSEVYSEELDAEDDMEEGEDDFGSEYGDCG